MIKNKRLEPPKQRRNRRKSFCQPIANSNMKWRPVKPKEKKAQVVENDELCGLFRQISFEKSLTKSIQTPGLIEEGLLQFENALLSTRIGIKEEEENEELDTSHCKDKIFDDNHGDTSTTSLSKGNNQNEFVSQHQEHQNIPKINLSLNSIPLEGPSTFRDNHTPTPCSSDKFIDLDSIVKITQADIKQIKKNKDDFYQIKKNKDNSYHKNNDNDSDSSSDDIVLVTQDLPSKPISISKTLSDQIQINKVNDTYLRNLLPLLLQQQKEMQCVINTNVRILNSIISLLDNRNDNNNKMKNPCPKTKKHSNMKMFLRFVYRIVVLFFIIFFILLTLFTFTDFET